MGTTKRPRLGLLGCGARGRDHLKGALRSEAFELVAAADLDATRLGETCDAFGIKARYADYHAMLAKENLDVLHICTMPTFRLPPVEAAAKAGVRAIVVEKPMAFDYSEARRMVESCSAAGALLVVNHQMRGMVEWIRLKDAVTTGKLGKVLSLRSSCWSNLLGQGTHMLDIAWDMLGEPAAKWVLATAQQEVSEGPLHPGPRNSLALIEYANGVRGTFAIGSDSPPIPNSETHWFWCNVEIRGTEGRAESILNEGYKRWDKHGNLLETVESRWDDTHQGAGQAKLSADIARALNEPSFRHPQRGESALVSYEMLEAICRSSLGCGKVVHFPITPGEDALARWTRR